MFILRIVNSATQIPKLDYYSFVVRSTTAIHVCLIFYMQL